MVSPSCCLLDIVSAYSHLYSYLQILTPFARKLSASLRVYFTFFRVSTRYSGIKNLARSMCGVAGSQPKFYDTIQSHTMVAANGVISEILTKLPGINDLSKLKVSAPVTWWYKVVEWSDCVHLSVNLIPKSTDYIKLKVIWWYMGCLDKPRWCREKCGVH